MLESFWTLKNALVPFAKVHRFGVEELAFLNRCCEGNPHGWIQPSPCWIAAHGIPLRHLRPCSAYSINNIQQQTIKKKHEKTTTATTTTTRAAIAAVLLPVFLLLFFLLGVAPTTSCSFLFHLAHVFLLFGGWSLFLFLSFLVFLLLLPGNSVLTKPIRQQSNRQRKLPALHSCWLSVQLMQCTHVDKQEVCNMKPLTKQLDQSLLRKRWSLLSGRAVTCFYDQKTCTTNSWENNQRNLWLLTGQHPSRIT